MPTAKVFEMAFGLALPGTFACAVCRRRASADDCAGLCVREPTAYPGSERLHLAHDVHAERYRPFSFF